MKTSWTVIKVKGKKEKFDIDKIADSIFLAAQDVGGTDEALSLALAEKVNTYLMEQLGRSKEISTRDVGDAVERILMEGKHVRTARAYILNRDKKREEMEAKIRMGVVDDVGMNLNSLLVMKKKYLQGDETPGEAFGRVAKALANQEAVSKRKEWEQKFRRVMQERKFLPGGRTLANAGTVNNQLANCFVLPFPDDIEGIFEIVKESSILKKNGGGVGFSFKEVRPKGDGVSTTSGRACGPVALMSILNDASDIFVQAGGRRSGNMVTLPVTHPDIFEFIACKESGANLPHINYSIAVTDKFMEAVVADREWDLINPRTGSKVQRLRARSILEQAARLAWKNGDPGIIYIDTINHDNPTPQVGNLDTVNLCGEQPLLPYEACNLGSVNLAAHLRIGEHKHLELDYDLLDETVRIGVRLLDNVVSVCTYPVQKIDKVVKSNRKIGLGVMGFADLLVKLKVGYGSKESITLAENIMRRIQKVAHETSEALGKEKGNFPNFKGSLWEDRGYKHFRNATTTTIAPTGSISMIAGCSYGIEPHFALAYYKKVMGDYELPELNKDLVVALKRLNGVYSNELIEEIAKMGSIKHLKHLPKSLREVFVTAMDIEAAAHVEMQAAFQRYTDNAVSKTINMPASATMDDVYETYILAWRLKCKGITVYRDKSREIQVLNVGKSKLDHAIKRSNDQTNPCPECGAKMTLHEGCMSCESCGFSKCSL